jgi:intracellular sulfur oxidation DsrE/DsrF family protein
MDRRGIFGIMAATLFGVPLVVRSAAAEGEKRTHKLVIHVDQNDADVMKLAMNNTKNANELYAAKGDSLEVEIVCYSQGLHMLRDDTSPVKDEIHALRKAVPQVRFGACNNTKMGMEKREGKPVPIIPEATIVPAGIVRLVELQEQGYAYAKP